MTSIPVKEISSMMGRTAAPGVGKAGKQTQGASFEEVWSQQTDKGDSVEVEYDTEETKELHKDDDNNLVRDSLKAKDTRDSGIKENEPAENGQSHDFNQMDSKEWERAMEVLGGAVTNMMQEIADAFDMTMEEVQGLMNELGMEPIDVLQQESLSQLLLAAGGAEDTTALLTNESLYQNYQSVMEQLDAVLEQSSEVLQTDAGQLLEAMTQNADADTTIAEAEMLPIEVEVEEAVPAAEMAEEADDKLSDVEVAEDGTVQMETGRRTTVTEADNNAQLMNQNHNGGQAEQNATAGREVADDKGQTPNIMLQNLRTEHFEPQLQQLTQTTSVWDGETVDIMRQIMDYMRIQVKPDMSNLEMQLHPESLGTLQVHVAAKDGAVTAQFVTQNETVKAALESQMIQLKESFAEQGVKVDAIEVTVQTHQFEQNLEQGRGRQQEETTGRRSGTRRLRLDGIFSAEERNNLGEEEQIAVEMMEANGNTVDFTA